MAIMPHTDVEAALDFALSLDIPFWPQLPNVGFHEDMYVQASAGFPGIVVATGERKISFNTTLFEAEVGLYAQRMGETETFALGAEHSSVYQGFLARDLGRYAAIRGQVTGPVSFGFRVMDETLRPMIYHDDARTLLFDFIRRKVNAQYRQLSERNRHAFVWVDEPGLGWVFSGLSGYSDTRARRDYGELWAGSDGPRGLHLCASVNLPYLLQLGAQVVSFDAYQAGLVPEGYARAVADFLAGGGVISWGIVPTDGGDLGRHTPETLEALLLGYWEDISRASGLAVSRIARQSLLAPARCCLKNAGCVGASDDKRAAGAGRDEVRIVERAFGYLRTLSRSLRDRFGLSSPAY